MNRAEAKRWVHKRLPETSDLKFSLYHHPMAGVDFDWISTGGPAKRSGLFKKNTSQPMSVLVDLVGGRASATDPWNRDGLVPLSEELSKHNNGAEPVITPPTSAVSVEDAEHSAYEIAGSVILRQRRMGTRRQLHQSREAVLFGKPNWWVTGEHKGRKLEMILDAVTGKYYMFSG